jgi:transposase
MVALVGKLCSVERELRGRSPDECKVAREVRSKPLLDKIKAWLDDKAPGSCSRGCSASPSPTPSDTLGLWPQLAAFLEVKGAELTGARLNFGYSDRKNTK